MSTVGQARTAEEIKKDWETNPRWKGITRNYTAEDVEALQGTVVEENTLARRGAEILLTPSTKRATATSTPSALSPVTRLSSRFALG